VRQRPDISCSVVGNNGDARTKRFRLQYYFAPARFDLPYLYVDSLFHFILYGGANKSNKILIIFLLKLSDFQCRSLAQGQAESGKKLAHPLPH